MREDECQGLHIHASFTVDVYDLTDSAKSLLSWFNNKLAKMPELSKLSTYFQIEIKPDPDTGEEKLEVANLAPDYFSTSALIVLWAEMTREKIPLKVVSNPNMN